MDKYVGKYGVSEETGKKRTEFMQRVVLIAFLGSILIVLAMVALNFLLLWSDKQSMSQETVAAITTYGGLTATITTAVYGTLTAVRNWSLNKYINGGNTDDNHS